MFNPRYCLILMLIFSVNFAFAQKKGDYPNEPEAFVKAMADFMGASKKDGKKFVEGDFEDVYLSGQITPEMQAIVVSTCNKFKQAKFTAYPEYNNYLHAVMHFPKSQQNQAFFMNWHEVMYKMLENKRMKKELGEFLEHSSTLFEKRVFFSTNAVEWAFGSTNYAFKYDSLPKIEYPEGTLICYTKGDSTRILKTKGIFFPSLERWFGEGGRVNWDRADFNPETTYATFDTYEIRIKGSSYTIDSVLFYNDYFDSAAKRTADRKGTSEPDR